MTVSLRGVRPNIVQSIRAFRVQRPAGGGARGLGQHFLYANLANAQSKQDVLDLIAQQFTFPTHFGKNFDALYDCMTDPLHKSGPQPGFIVVLEQIPANAKFDKEAREQLLDIFRDASDYWGGPQDTVQMLLFFSVARSAQTSQAERANEANKAQPDGTAASRSHRPNPAAEKMPTDKLVDVSPLALRMSSPFNAGYWLAAA